MAVNVTQKDRTLNEVIDWCGRQVADIDSMTPDNIDHDFAMGQRHALNTVIAHCRSRLGYSGPMPLEVPNQSAKE